MTDLPVQASNETITPIISTLAGGILLPVRFVALDNHPYVRSIKGVTRWLRRAILGVEAAEATLRTILRGHSVGDGESV